jgi:hypothetical protein
VSATAATGLLDGLAPRAESPSRLAWRRLRRDRAALVSGCFLLFLLFAVLPGAPLVEQAVGHGPNDPFPYAVDVSLRPVGPWTAAMDVGLALGIALYIESVYRLPGLGLTTLSALNGGVGFDLPMILGIVLVVGIVIIVLNFAIDLIVLWMDPRAAQAGTRRSAVGRIA